MKKVWVLCIAFLLVMWIALMLSSCSKSDGCGTVVGWYASGSGALYLEVDYYGEVKRKMVSESVFLKADVGTTYCD